jgi:tetratricopeptide (TPR) repeat protein
MSHRISHLFKNATEEGPIVPGVPHWDAYFYIGDPRAEDNERPTMEGPVGYEGAWPLNQGQDDKEGPCEVGEIVDIMAIDRDQADDDCDSKDCDGADVPKGKDFENLRPPPKMMESQSLARLQVDPKDPEALSEMASALVAQDRADEALKYRQRYCDAYPDCAVGWHMLADCHEQLDQIDDAIAAYKNALNIHPHYLDAIVDLANTYVDNEQYEAAIEIVQAEIDHVDDMNLEDVHENYGELWQIKGESLMHQGMSYLALLNYRDGTDRFPNDPALLKGLGEAIIEQGGDLNEAIYCFQRALSIVPDDLSYNMAYAKALIAARHYEEAYKTLDLAEEIADDMVKEEGPRYLTSEIYHTRVEWCVATGDFTGALYNARCAKAVNMMLLEFAQLDRVKTQKAAGLDGEASACETQATEYNEALDEWILNLEHKKAHPEDDGFDASFDSGDDPDEGFGQLVPC